MCLDAPLYIVDFLTAVLWLYRTIGKAFYFAKSLPYFSAYTLTRFCNRFIVKKVSL